ncbi:hypothetical protein WA158_000631 [Blastocystis sp. Blastoise]
MLFFVYFSLFFLLTFAGDFRNTPVEIFINATSHYGAGVQFAMYTKDLTADFIYSNPVFRESYVPFYVSQEGRKIYDELYAYHNATFPDYMEELRGMSESVGCPFFLLFMNSLNEEFSYFMPSHLKYPKEDHCSDIIIHDKDTHIIAHNEDGSTLNINHTILAHVLIYKNKTLSSNFTSYCYPAQLPTAAFGWNEDIVFSMNYLHTSSYDRKGISRNFIARYLLDSSSYEDAVQRITKTPHFVGHNYQLTSNPSSKHNPTTSVVDIEIAPFFRIGYVEALPSRPHFHANMYDIIMVDDTPSNSSIYREQVYKQYNPPTTISEALQILGDEYPLYYINL